ncbi:hypothetical protein [Labrenzia sp. CE80]|uniref:hypothetical protein n=1 Tax=Labrenzia sp. CE80 TaxID=1788986 RepID=UPI001389F037|nr:hypothetical protein [Labrenzia sp. CE80]
MAPRKAKTQTAPKSPEASKAVTGDPAVATPATTAQTEAAAKDDKPKTAPASKPASPASSKVLADAKTEALVKGVIVSPLRCNGKRYRVGDPISLPAGELAALQKAGVISPA